MASSNGILGALSNRGVVEDPEYKTDWGLPDRAKLTGQAGSQKSNRGPSLQGVLFPTRFSWEGGVNTPRTGEIHTPAEAGSRSTVQRARV
jgi:hypothetical protein